MSWQEFALGAPEMAAYGQQEFERARVAVIGTIRSDGSPRISCVDPCILEGQLYLGMMWRSRKALDLLRDPRIIIRNAVCTNTGRESELTLRGRALEVTDSAARTRFIQAVFDRTEWREPFHLFSMEIEHAAMVRYEASRQLVELWPEGRASARTY